MQRLRQAVPRDAQVGAEPAPAAASSARIHQRLQRGEQPGVKLRKLIVGQAGGRPRLCDAAKQRVRTTAAASASGGFCAPRPCDQSQRRNPPARLG